MDALQTVLRSLRLTSAFLRLAHFRGGFGVTGKSGSGKMIFHGIAEGECYVKREADGVVRHLQAGDVVVLTRGDEHSMFSSPTHGVQPVSSVVSRVLHGMPVYQYGTQGTETRLVCGTFELAHPAQASVIDLLPPVLVAKPQGDVQRRWSHATVSLIEAEIMEAGATVRTTSLADSLFMSALGDEANGSANSPSSLLAAARDERVGRALALIHSEPSRGWSVAELASEVGMSRTRFFQRFSDLVGEPPAKYIARWRTLVAADLLRKQSLSTREVAEHVGYSDEDALTKVFKRYMGMSPTEYRRLDAN